MNDDFDLVETQPLDLADLLELLGDRGQAA
jgi:hypothetical protein